MARIPQNLFTWQEVFPESDLDRLKMIRDGLPDEEVIRFLERERGQGRNDYPIRPTWNSILAGIVYQHASVESLRRELLRNGELRDVCGFDPILGAKAVPTPRAYSHLMGLLMKHRGELDKIFDKLVDEIKEVLPDYGKYLGIDSKAVNSAGKPTEEEKRDGRRDIDADWGKKEYRGRREDGTVWEKIVKWFGYKIHLLADTNYELPISYKVTRASVNDSPVLEELFKKTEDRHPQILEDAEELTADRGYDSEENNKLLWDEYKIKPLIDIRDMWKDEKGQTRPLYPDKVDNIVYDFEGTIYCHCPLTERRYTMAYQGFEKDRQTLKYRCPAKAYGFSCKGQAVCSGDNGYGRIVRVPLETDRRIFTPIARSSYAWRREYKRRTAVERINSRIDLSFGFEHHFIRGLAKMEVKVSLAMIVMLGMALGSIKAKQKGLMRSLVKRRPRTKPEIRDCVLQAVA